MKNLRFGCSLLVFSLVVAMAVSPHAMSTESMNLVSRDAMATQNCVPPPSGLVAWWPGDGNANDIIGGNHGALRNGATVAPGMVGQAFSLDGIDDYVSTNLDVQPSAMPSTTWDARVFIPSDAGGGTIFGNDDGGFDRLVYGGVGGTGKFGVFTGSGAWEPTTVTPNQWQHIAVVYTPTNIEFYKNGVRFWFGQAPIGQASGLRGCFKSGDWPLNPTDGSQWIVQVRLTH